MGLLPSCYLYFWHKHKHIKEQFSFACEYKMNHQTNSKLLVDNFKPKQLLNTVNISKNFYKITENISKKSGKFCRCGGEKKSWTYFIDVQLY